MTVKVCVCVPFGRRPVYMCFSVTTLLKSVCVGGEGGGIIDLFQASLSIVEGCHFLVCIDHTDAQGSCTMCTC